jgi:hypothetical protein
VAAARQALAEALARGQARHPAVPRNLPLIDEVRDVYRRSAGATPRLSQAELAAWYEQQLANVDDMIAFRAAPLRFDPDAFVPADVRARWMALPSEVEIRDRPVGLSYDVEELPDGTKQGTVRLLLPEKIARTLVESELPVFDRPVRFTVSRGARGAVRAASLDELQELLSRPWSSEEKGKERGGRNARDDRGGKRGGDRGNDRGPWKGKGKGGGGKRRRR